MQWKVNSRETIYDLKDNNLGICIHKICGLDGYYLSCHKLDVKDFDLKTTNFNEAVKQSQIVIMERATKLHELAVDFVKNVHDNNEFSRY